MDCVINGKKSSEALLTPNLVIDQTSIKHTVLKVAPVLLRHRQVLSAIKEKNSMA